MLKAKDDLPQGKLGGSEGCRGKRTPRVEERLDSLGPDPGRGSSGQDREHICNPVGSRTSGQ